MKNFLSNHKLMWLLIGVFIFTVVHLLEMANAIAVGIPFTTYLVGLISTAVVIGVLTFAFFKGEVE